MGSYENIEILKGEKYRMDTSRASFIDSLN